MNIACKHIIVSVIVILFSLPLVFRKVKMNGLYGIRVAEAFQSEERWYEINRFGGMLFLFWGVILGISGAMGARLESSQWPKYNLISTGIIVVGLAAVISAIFRYAAKTKKR